MKKSLNAKGNTNITNDNIRNKTENKIKYFGKKNQTKYPEFVNLCKLKQDELKTQLKSKLEYLGYDVIDKDGFLYVKGDIPILLTAHLDTVHKTPVEVFYEQECKGKHILTSPQGIGGDDRCGVYIILDILKRYKPSVLFCENEEVGGLGSDAFTKTEYIKDLKEMNFLIEVDRANANDAVFYNCNNDEFTKFITETTGYKTEWGSFSDISNLAPACNIAAVNLSCGYYNPHTLSEYVVVEDMYHTIEAIEKLLITESKQFEYVEGFVYDDWWDFGGGLSQCRYSQSYLDSYDKGNYFGMVFYYNTPDGQTKEDVVYGEDEEDALLKFLVRNNRICYGDIYDWDYLT